MKALLANLGFKMKALFAATVAASAMSCGDKLEVRTFDLEQLEPSAAEELISPYVFRDRDGAPGLVSHTTGVLTVREMPENLARIEEVLERYDQAASDVQLHFQLIEANGFTDSEESIADVEAELRKMLKYDGYRLVGDAVVQVREGGGHTEQRLQRQPSAQESSGPVAQFVVMAEVSRVSRSDTESSVLLAVDLSDPWNRLLATTVSVSDGKTMVLGTTAGASHEEGQAAALILVVTPTIR